MAGQLGNTEVGALSQSGVIFNCMHTTLQWGFSAAKLEFTGSPQMWVVAIIIVFIFTVTSAVHYDS